MFTVESGSFLNSLQKMQNSFQGLDVLSFDLVVPPEMVWWYWQEFGTALFAEKGTDNPYGYTIVPKNAKALRFYDRNVGDFRIAKEVFVYGIPAHHMVTNSLPEIRVTIKGYVAQAMKESGYDMLALKEILLTKMMPEIKEIVRQAFEAALDNSPRPGGKLDVPAAVEFENKATIVDTSR